MNLDKDIAARVAGIDQAALDVYLDHRREKLRDRMERATDQFQIAQLQGALAELKDLKTLVASAEESLRS